MRSCFPGLRRGGKSLIEDPDIHLSYTDRQRIKRGEYADVAEEKIPVIKRRMWWIKGNAIVSAFLLVTGAVLTGLSGVLPTTGVELGFRIRSSRTSPRSFLWGSVWERAPSGECGGRQSWSSNVFSANWWSLRVSTSQLARKRKQPPNPR